MLDRLRSYFGKSTALQAYQSPENPSTPLSWPAQWLVELMGGGITKTGVMVSNETAMRSSAVYGCVSLLAQTIASLPLKVYRSEKDTGAPMEAPDHPGYYLLHDEPNPSMTSTVWREYLMTNLLLGGNAYAAIGRSKGGTLLDLFPIPYSAVTPERIDGRLRYAVRLSDGTNEYLDQGDMLHVPGLGFDGVRGLSVISNAAREAIGLSLATEEHGSRMFANGATMQVVMTHPKTLSEGAQKRLKAQYEEHHVGLSNVARAMIVEEGMSVSNVSMTAEDAQFLETRRFQVEDVARFFRVPPHMIGHTDKQTSWGTGVEQNTLGFLMFTLIPWLVRFEQEMNRKLFPRSPFYAQFKTQGLMRGDSKARSDYYSKGFMNGWLSINEIRRAEDFSPISGGDRYFVPVNLVPLDQVGKVPATATDPATPDPSEPDPNEPDPNEPDPNEPAPTPAQEELRKKTRR